MKKNFKNLLKGVLAFALVIMLVLPNVMFIYGEDEKEDRSKTQVISTKFYDGKGEEIKVKDNVLNFEGSDLTLEYIIQPQDIKNNGSAASFDVTFVADMTYGMGSDDNKVLYVDNELTLENFLSSRNYKKYSDFNDFNRSVSAGGAVVEKQVGSRYARFTIYQVVGRGYDAQFLDDLKTYFNTQIKDKLYFVKTSNSEGVWYNEAEARANYNAAKNSKVLKYVAVQNCIRAFVDKINEYSNFSARIAIVPFNKRVDSNVSFTELPKSSLDGIYDTINLLKPKEYKDYSQPNGGDGLRYTYYLNKNDNIGVNKYVIYLTDGTSDSWSKKETEYNFFSGEGIVKNVKDTDYLSMLSNGDKANYGEYYIKYIANNLIGSDNLIRKSYVIGIGDQDIKAQRDQNESVASILNGYVDYDINKGPNEPVSDSNTKTTYNNGATAQNIKDKIKDVYYPLSNGANGMKDVFLNIAENILKDITVTNAKLDIPFISKLQTEKAGELPKDAFVLANSSNGVVNPSVEEVIKVVENGNTFYRKVNDINSKFNIVIENGKYVLKGDLTQGFKYTLDKDTNIYKANPIRITINLKTSEENKKNKLEIGEGSFKYNVGRAEYSTKLLAKSFGISSKKANLVDVDFVIDEFENTAKLKLTSLDDFKKISIVDKDKNILKDGWHYSDTTKGSEYELDIVEKIEKLEKDKFFYIKVERTANDSNPYYERVEVLTNEGVETKAEEVKFYTADEMKEPDNNKKEAILKIGAGEAVDISLADKVSFSYTIDKKTSTTPDIAKDINDKVYKIGGIELYDMEYIKKQSAENDVFHKSGNNEVKVSVTNAYNNKTTIIAAVEFHTRGPLFKNVEIIGEGGKYYLVAELTDESEDLNKENPGEIKIYSDGKPEDKPDVVKAKIDGENPRKVKVELVDTNGKPIDYFDKTIKIYGIDVNNNGGITEHKSDAKVKSGLINPSKLKEQDNGFLPEETTKILPNFRYSYGVDLKYSGGEVTLEAKNGGTVKATTYTIYKKSDKSKVTIGDKSSWKTTTDSSGKVVINPVGLPEGEEYIFVVNTIFKPAGETKKIEIKTTYKGGVDEKTYQTTDKLILQ